MLCMCLRPYKHNQNTYVYILFHVHTLYLNIFLWITFCHDDYRREFSGFFFISFNLLFFHFPHASNIIPEIKWIKAINKKT